MNTNIRKQCILLVRCIVSKENFFSSDKKQNSAFLFDIKKNGFSPLVMPKTTPKTQTKTINDFDSSLILEKINKTITNKAVKLGMKISTLQKELKSVNEKIELLKLLNLEADKKKLSALIQVKENIEGSLIKLEEEQKRKGIFYYFYSFFDEKFHISKFIDTAITIFNPYLNRLKKYFLNLAEKLFNYVKSNINKSQL